MTDNNNKCIWYYPFRTYNKPLKVYCPECKYKLPMYIHERPHPEDFDIYAECLRKKSCGKIWVINLNFNENGLKINFIESGVVKIR